MTEFFQLNFKKAFTAAVDINKHVKCLDKYIVLASETYNFKNKVRSLPPKAKVINGPNPRAAIIYGPGLEIIKLDHLTARYLRGGTRTN